jgi:hypothetical protein
VRHARHAFDDAAHAVSLHLLAEAVHELGRHRAVDLGEGEVELAADAG